MNLVSFFDRLNRFSLYFLLFLIPLFFLPFSQDVLNFPKQIIALILIFLSLIGWLAKGAFQGSLILRKNKVFYLSLSLVFLSLLLSSFFSLSWRISFFGSPLGATDSFLTFLLFLVFLFLIINSFRKESEFLSFLFFFLLGGALAGILNLFQIYQIFIFPFDFAKTVSFNTIGTTHSLALFAAAVLPISLILFFNSKGFLKIILGLISFVFVINVILINFRTAWAVLIVAILLLFVFGIANQKNKIKPGWVALLMIGLTVSLFFYFSPLPLSGFPVLPPEVSLTSVSGMNILKESFNEGIKNTAIGTGPGTFIFNYSKYRSPLLNQTLFWGTRFSEGSSSFSDWILTKGILGGITLLFLYFLIVYFIFKNLKKTENNNFYEIKLGLSAGVFGLIWISFFYVLNFTLYFTFWFLLAGLILFFNPKFKEINLSSHSKMIFINLALVLIFIFSLSLIFFQGQRYLAEAKYLKAVSYSQFGNIDNAINYTQQAINFNPFFDVYWRDLSQLFLIQANLASQNLEISSQEEANLINSAIIDGAEAINQAISISPINVANWNVRGFFYQNLIGIQGADELALASYRRAIELEPASPFAFGEKARIYILMAQENIQKQEIELQQKNLDSAIENLTTAIQLKPDYTPAHYLLAVAYDQKGELKEAIAKLEETKTIISQDAGIAFQLGLLYWRKQDFDKAEQEFERAISLNPDYSNARYMLGLAYDQKQEPEKAKKEFEIIAQTNPENQEVKKILDNIEKGLSALEGVVISEPPIQEIPSEIEISPY